MKLVINNKLCVQGATVSFQKALKDRLTIKNPAWLENDHMGRYNGNTPKHLRFYEEAEDDVLVVPRGFTRQVIGLAHEHGTTCKIDDQCRVLPEIEFTFHGELRPFQKQAASDILQRNFGTLFAPTGAGKTIIALHTIAERKQPTLIVVHTRELLNQWLSRIEQFLNIPACEIGVIGGGQKIIGQKITVATVQSLYKCADDVAQHIGHLVVDEVHRAPSRTFTKVVVSFDGRYMCGLSATPWRRDKLSRLIYWHIGGIVHKVDRADLVKNGDILQADVIFRKTNFSTRLNASIEYSKMLSELTQDLKRNNLISSDIARLIAIEANDDRGICLVLSDRKAHCEVLQQILMHNYNVSSVALLTSAVSAKKRQDIINRLNEGKIKVLIATGQLIGEGFDCNRLSKLFLTTPVRFDGRVLQYLGRILRPAEGKAKPVVYDYVDSRVGVLRASAKARQKALVL